MNLIVPLNNFSGSKSLNNIIVDPIFSQTIKKFLAFAPNSKILWENEHFHTPKPLN